MAIKAQPTTEQAQFIEQVEQGIIRTESEGEREVHYDENDRQVCVHDSWKEGEGDIKWVYYDERGNPLQTLYYNEKENAYFEEWNDYDEDGNTTHYKNGKSFEWWAKYNSYGNRIYYKDTTNVEWWKEYDENWNQTYYKRGSEEWWKEYNAKNDLVYFKRDLGLEDFTHFADRLSAITTAKVLIDRRPK